MQRRFLWATDVAWDRAGRAEARDFALRLKMMKKPPRPRRPDAPRPDAVNPVTGKASPGERYAARTRRHARAAVRSFYEYHREMHGRPLVNPFPKARGGEEDLNAHHNPMQPFRRPSRRRLAELARYGMNADASTIRRHGDGRPASPSAR